MCKADYETAKQRGETLKLKAPYSYRKSKLGSLTKMGSLTNQSEMTIITL